MSRLRTDLMHDPDLRVLINADRDLPFDQLDTIFDRLIDIGATNVAIITRQTERRL